MRTLIAVALERGIHSIQGSVVSMGTALMLLLAPRLAGHTGKRKLQGRKKVAGIEGSYVGGNSQLDEATSLHKWVFLAWHMYHMGFPINLT